MSAQPINREVLRLNIPEEEPEEQPSSSLFNRSSGTENLIQLQLNNLKQIKKRNFLGTILLNMRSHRLVVQFINRLKLNSTKLQDREIQKRLENLNYQSRSVEYIFYQQQHQRQLQLFLLSLQLISLLFSYCFLTIQLFLDDSKQINTLSIISIFIFQTFTIIQLLWLSLSTKTQQTTLKQFLHNFRSHIQYIDIFLIILAILHFAIGKQIILCLTVVAVIYKLLELSCKMERRQLCLIKFNEIHKYWDIIKLVIFNIAIAHTISLFLNLAAQQSQNNFGKSWYSLKQMNVNSCGQKYLWGFYWAISFMFTIGFGDINATTSIQAFTVIAVSICSCMVLANNISKIHKVIQKNSVKEDELKSRLSGFYKISKCYEMFNSKKSYYQNYIYNEVQDKLKYNEAQEQKIIESLPQKLQLDLKRQINFNTFRNIPFFCELTQKTIYLLAENLINKVAHPNEILINKNQPWKIQFLRQGELKLCLKMKYSMLNGMVLQKFKVEKNQYSRLLSLKFLKNHFIQGDLIACARSIIGELSLDNFRKCLQKSSPFTFEDKNQEYLFNYGTKTCQVCHCYSHNITDCPKLHFFPIKHMVIYRTLATGNKLKQSRIKAKRSASRRYRTLQQASVRLQFEGKHKGAQLEFVKILKQNIALHKSSKVQEITNNEQIDNFNLSENKLQNLQNKVDQIMDYLLNQDSFFKKINIQCDQAHNFIKYYSEFNPCQLNKPKTVHTKPSNLKPQSPLFNAIPQVQNQPN